MSEQDDLENLLKSPGWLRLHAYVKETWGEQITQYVTQATSDSDDIMALNKLRQVVAAKNAVERLLAWPAERLRHLGDETARSQAPVSLSRRGGL